VRILLTSKKSLIEKSSEYGGGGLKDETDELLRMIGYVNALYFLLYRLLIFITQSTNK
jgi:hypothetical protein